MSFINAIILGLVQGLTEFLPISSSAHVRIVGELLGTGADPGAAFTAIIQLGTEAAVIVYFAPDLGRIISRWFLSLFKRVPRNDSDAKIGWYIIFGSIPIVVLGLLFQKQIETTLRSLWVIAATMIIFGILLGIADYVGAKKRRLRDLTVPHATIYGFAQSLALIPGVSRSGATITAGLFMGYERAAAARYSFLLAIPAVIGSGFFELYKTIKHPSGGVPEVFGPAETAVATVVAFGVGLLVIVVFMNYISKRSFLPFVIYRLALGVALVILLLTGVLRPN
ncbi:undecaprenyl-diphosphate phosphatase [Glaciihabitans sp. UYNi722]|uniref:undecaprenyl-diphosphate phosphatase n=1 Tax=Glaciihabitans sp. UYNi722 TaxID=3156344 RepID=UPI00339490D4